MNEWKPNKQKSFLTFNIYLCLKKKRNENEKSLKYISNFQFDQSINRLDIDPENEKKIPKKREKPVSKHDNPSVDLIHHHHYDQYFIIEQRKKEIFLDETPIEEENENKNKIRIITGYMHHHRMIHIFY